MRLSLIRLHRPFGRYFRRKRFRQFLSAFGVSRETRVLDVGGLQYYWQFSDLLPRVTTVNLEWPSAGQRPGDWVIADARMLPFREKSFEVAFSNSVIEHISDPADRQSFARELGRVAERYYVQTPNFWFPVEPHLMTPFVHYLPQTLQRRLLRNFTVWGILVRPTPEGCDDFLRDIRMLDERELRQLFPEAEIWRERVLGITKSLIAAYR